MATRRRTCGRTAASCRPRSSPARPGSAGACSLGWAPTTSSRTSRGWRRSSRRRRTWCFWASGAWRRSGDWTVLSRDGPGRAQKCRNPRDIGAFRGWLRVFSKASEASGTGCRRRAGPILASDFCMLALLQRLGEALRGAGVPTPHAALRHADVTLSPRRPRSCGQR